MIPFIGGMACLPHLSSIEVRLKYFNAFLYDNKNPHHNIDNNALASDLARELPSLRKIYLRTLWYPVGSRNEYRIWELRESWKVRKVQNFSPWSITKGLLE
jgi:hypothetical protein